MSAAGAAVTLSLCACGTSSGQHQTRPHTGLTPEHTVALPADVRSATAVEPNGYDWVLAGSHGVVTLTQLQLPNGGKAATEPVSAAATSVAQSPQGEIVLGTATATAGSLEYLNPAGQAPKTVPVGGPVRDVAYGPSGEYIYVLNGLSRSRSVTVFRSLGRRPVMTVGVSSETTAVIPTPDETAVWSLTPSGTVTETALPSGKTMTTVSVGGAGIALALSPDGGTLYVLKGTGASDNVAVIRTATSSISKVLPAAAHSVGLQISLNSNQLYDYVGSSQFGNVQIFNL